jgi:hypothetical protein
MIIGYCAGCAAMEKYNSNTQFAPLRETPFALRGKNCSGLLYAFFHVFSRQQSI